MTRAQKLNALALEASRAVASQGPLGNWCSKIVWDLAKLAVPPKAIKTPKGPAGNRHDPKPELGPVI